MMSYDVGAISEAVLWDHWMIQVPSLLGCSGPTMSHPNIADCVAAKNSV